MTNAEFARFVAAGGYDDQDCWTDEGWKWRQRNQEITKPRLFDNIDYNNPAQPVVGVTWYEAAAYCNWLTVQGRAQGWLPAEDDFRLPTSLEWERVARHTDQRRYPMWRCWSPGR